VNYSVPVIPGSWVFGILLLFSAPGGEERPLPPAPSSHFTDATSKVAKDVAERLDARLAGYERETTNQVVVAVFDKLPWTPLEEFTLATANAWRIGQKGKDNGIILFLFLEDRRLRLQVGRGLVKSLTDALAQRIVDEVLVPRLRAGDLSGALEAGVEAVISVLSGRPLPTPSPLPPAAR
jgi:uncharacterized protein